jgi:ABC-type bacteriocin/lantibiotic exporter with double-glycine peptidase domain
MKKIKAISKIFVIFSKLDISVIFTLTIISSFLEILGIFSIIPLVTSIFNEDIILNNEKALMVLNYFEFLTKSNFIYFLAGLVIFLNISINFFNLISQYIIHKLCWKNQYKINRVLFKNYFSTTSDNEALLSSSTFRRITGDVDTVRSGIILSSINIISRLFTIICIITFISFVNFKVSIIIFLTIVVFYLSFYKSISGIIKKNSILHLNTITDRIRVMRDILDSFKQLKVMNLHQNFINHYHEQFRNLKNIDITNKLLSILPRHILEPIFISFFIILFILSKNNQSVNLDVGIYVAIVYTFFRLAPLFQNLYSNYTTIKKYYVIYINLINNLNLDDFKNIKSTPKEVNIEAIKKIKLNNFSFSYDNKNNIFSNQNVVFEIGKSYFIEGLNGSGKTTLIDILMLLLKIQKGNILINDRELKVSEHLNFQSNFSYTPQKNHIFETTISKNISLETKENKINYEKIEGLIKFMEFENIFSKLKGSNNYLASSGKNISGGQAQRIGILRSLYFDKKILVFDEATNQIDSESEQIILNKILSISKNKIVIFVSHNKNLKKYFSDTLKINDLGITAEKNG